MWRRFLLTWSIVALSSPAVAEQGEAETRAYEEFERGRRLFEAEDFLAAAQRFVEAYRILPSAAVHYNIARSYELADVHDLAAQHYRAFLDARAGSPSRRRQVAERLAAMSPGLGWVEVGSEPSGGTVSVDGRERGTTPVLVALAAGSRVVRVVSGELSVVTTVEVSEGEDTTVTLVLEPLETQEGVFDDPDQAGGEPATGATVSGGTETPARAPLGRRGVGRLHHGWFWASLVLSLGSGGALAGVGTRMLELAAAYQAGGDEFRAEGLLYERVTTGLWISTATLVGITILLAVFTDWSTLGRRPDPPEATAPGWMPARAWIPALALP